VFLKQFLYFELYLVFESTTNMTMFLRTLSVFILLLQQTCPSFANDRNKLYTDEYKAIRHHINDKTITITVSDQKLSITIDYSNGCIVKQLSINGKNTLGAAGVYTGIRTQSGSYTSGMSVANLQVTKSSGGIKISGIRYGDESIMVNEVWDFKLAGNKIRWNIVRNYSKAAVLEDMAFPSWNFADLSVWKGGIIDNGGMIWCKYLRQVNDTYGVHTGGTTFWNAESGDALRIAAKPGAGTEIASKYSHSEQGEFRATQLVTDTQLQQRYNLSRFVAKKADVFASFEVKKGKVAISLELEYMDYAKTYSRGILPGIDTIAVRELLNTTGRYGVVDNNIIGANGWLTNWKCLHEPFFAQIGMALNDENYTRNMSATLDQERDQAMLADGRVLSRWHNVPGDEIPGTYNSKTGYYEAMWGYTIDSQTGYVINTSEQFELNGDTSWLRAHKKSAEKALDWLIRRDSNENGIFEMMNNGIAEKKASDWLDIVWAGFENSFVNAQLYEALILWSNCEKILGDQQKGEEYLALAARLKTSFNKPVDEGGFWSPQKKQYIYWRDQDGSIHGDNLVTPVNFAAIAFGLCDDPERVALILDQIESRSLAENLFHWPLCFDSFARAEVHDNNWPFPKYENGDIFPTWGYLGIRAYAKYDKAIALKYINNILRQYEKDGLSSQRYSRTTQLGLGNDILAGISTSITALYRDIYGIRPKWNRMGLEPNMSPVLNGTKFSYTHLGIPYQLALSVDSYLMSGNGFTLKSSQGFGAKKTGDVLSFYPHNEDKMVLEVNAKSGASIAMEMGLWKDDQLFSWMMLGAGDYQFKVKGLHPGSTYQLRINNEQRNIRADERGLLVIKAVCQPQTKFMVKKEDS
jgi:hypothetical protein